MNIKRAAAGAHLATLLPFAGALAQTTPPSQPATSGNTNDDLRAEIEEQKQRLLVLERKLEIQQEAAAAMVPTTPRITASASRFQVGSADGANFIRLRGTLHVDARTYGGESVPETADTIILRRVRPTIEGTFGNIFDFKFMPDFAGGRSVIVDAYVAARLFFQPFINSENFNLRGLGFGVGTTWVDVDGSAANTALSAYRSPGQQSVFAYRANTATGVTPNNATFANGERLRLAPQLYYYRGSFGLLGEYTQVEQDVSRVVGGTTLSDTLTHSAWQAQLSWFLTGEGETFRGFTPGSTYQVNKSGWGAFELVARYHELDLDDDTFVGGAASFANPLNAVTKASAYGVGVNWYPWNTVKLSLNYENTRFEGGAATGDRADEKALLSRFAVNF